MAKQIDEEEDKRVILNQYRGLLRDAKRSKSKRDKKLIRKAFDIATEAHSTMRRKSGEPYIMHPLAVARIVAGEMNMGTTSIVCALLHDTVEDTEITLDDVQKQFGTKVRTVIDGLTKISGVFDYTTSDQAENFRKMLITLSDDVRVILVKLADRLHNMRTLDSMRSDKQRKIASETLFLYAPLAHRFGLYALKSELEDLGLKYTEPEAFNDITQKLKKTDDVRKRFINRFIVPLRKALNDEGIKATIKGRPKSVYSIWNKMRKKNVDFEEVYDVFAIRIVLDSLPDNEKADCWKVYSVVTDYYMPNPDRLRDWISTPKANGYESLHTTIMSPTGKWVEVQIRTERMDEIAEKGFAAHWKYKGSEDSDKSLDQWLMQVREALENPDMSAIDFVDDFKLNLFSDEIFVFTPTGELKRLPKGATSLDFAFEIHTQVGARCIGAKVNQKLVPLSHILKSGDQVEILTSKKQSPKEDWLNFVITGKARSKIKSSLKEEMKRVAGDGKEMLQRKLRNLKVKFSSENIDQLLKFYQLKSVTELYYRIATNKLDLSKIKSLIVKGRNLNASRVKPAGETLEQIVKKIRGKAGELLIGDDLVKLDYKIARCCNPIPGDDVFGFITINDGIKIHRTTCPNAIQLMSNYAYRIVKARWTGQQVLEFLAGIQFTGIDDVGLVNNITSIISSELSINMRSISFDSKDGVFEGKVIAYVRDTEHLEKLMKKLSKVNGVLSVGRIEEN